MNRTLKEEYIFGSILLLSNKLQIWGDGILSDITLKQWFLLLLISKMDDKEPTVKEISDFTGTSRQNVKKMLSVLENKEYVAITKSDIDARALKVELTNKTYEYFSGFEKTGNEAIHTLFTNSTDQELEVTTTTLQNILKILENNYNGRENQNEKKI